MQPTNKFLYLITREENFKKFDWKSWKNFCFQFLGGKKLPIFIKLTKNLMCFTFQNFKLFFFIFSGHGIEFCLNFRAFFYLIIPAVLVKMAARHNWRGVYSDLFPHCVTLSWWQLTLIYAQGMWTLIVVYHEKFKKPSIGTRQIRYWPYYFLFVAVSLQFGVQSRINYLMEYRFCFEMLLRPNKCITFSMYKIWANISWMINLPIGAKTREKIKNSKFFKLWEKILSPKNSVQRKSPYAPKFPLRRWYLSQVDWYHQVLTEKSKLITK